VSLKSYRAVLSPLDPPGMQNKPLNETKETFIYIYVYIVSTCFDCIHFLFPILAGWQHWLDCAAQAGRDTDSCLCTPSNYFLDAPTVEIIWGAHQVRNHADRKYCKHVLWQTLTDETKSALHGSILEFSEKINLAYQATRGCKILQ
jgi:hypothetical protein